MLTLEQIARPGQSYIGLLDHSNIPTYRIPGQKFRNAMMGKTLSKTFLELCLDDSLVAFECGAVIGRARKSYRGEQWARIPRKGGYTTDSIDLLRNRGIMKSYSLYRGLISAIDHCKMPIYVPKTDLVYDGFKALEYLRQNNLCVDEIVHALVLWNKGNFAFRMNRQLMIKPNGQTVHKPSASLKKGDEVHDSSLFNSSLGGSIDDKIAARRRRLAKLFD